MRLRGSLKTKSALAAALRRYNVKALMLGSGDDETAGEGSYKVDWRDEKAPSSGLILSPLLMSPISQNINVCLFPTRLHHCLTSACYPAEPLPCFLRVISFSSFSLPSSSRALPFLILSLNGESCEQAMQMRWLLPHCSSSRTEETLIG